jgi:hypothetical protein
MPCGRNLFMFVAVAIGFGAPACAPGLDWREVRVAAAALLSPCRPASHARSVPLAGTSVVVTLHACQAAGATWAVAHADVADPSRVSAALQDLLRSAAANVAAREVPGTPWKVAGSTPNVHALRVDYEGRLPDGRPVRESVGTFAHGTQVFQVTVVGARKGDAFAVETFFGSVRVVS